MNPSILNPKWFNIFLDSHIHSNDSANLSNQVGKHLNGRMAPCTRLMLLLFSRWKVPFCVFFLVCYNGIASDRVHLVRFGFFIVVPLHFTRIILHIHTSISFLLIHVLHRKLKHSECKNKCINRCDMNEDWREKSGHKMWLFRLRFFWFVALCGYEILRRSNRSRSINKNK